MNEQNKLGHEDAQALRSVAAKIDVHGYGPPCTTAGEGWRELTAADGRFQEGDETTNSNGLTWKTVDDSRGLARPGAKIAIWVDGAAGDRARRRVLSSNGFERLYKHACIERAMLEAKLATQEQAALDIYAWTWSTPQLTEDAADGKWNVFRQAFGIGLGHGKRAMRLRQLQSTKSVSKLVPVPQPYKDAKAYAAMSIGCVSVPIPVDLVEVFKAGVVAAGGVVAE